MRPIPPGAGRLHDLDSSGADIRAGHVFQGNDERVAAGRSSTS